MFNVYFKRNFVCGVGREQNFGLNNKYDKLLSNYLYVKIAYCTLRSYLDDKDGIFSSISNSHQQIGEKIQSFHVNDLKNWLYTKFETSDCSLIMSNTNVYMS